MGLELLPNQIMENQDGHRDLGLEASKEKDPTVLSHSSGSGASFYDNYHQNKVFGEGDTIYGGGQKPQGIYLIKSGCVKIGTTRSVSRGRAHNSEYITKLAGPGEFFGFHALVDSNSLTHFAKTQRATEVQFYSQEVIASILSGPQNLMKALLGQMIADMEERENLSQLQYLASVQERIAFQILILADRFGVKKDDGVHLSLRLTRNELAQLAGTINESLSRHLTEMKAEGIVDLVGKTIIVKNRQALMEKSGNFKV